MTPTVFKTKMRWLRLDAAEFSKDIDVPLKHVEAWRTGKRKVPVIVERLLDAWTRNERLEMGVTRPNQVKRTR